jgi:hypothetical protein
MILSLIIRIVVTTQPHSEMMVLGTEVRVFVIMMLMVGVLPPIRGVIYRTQEFIRKGLAETVWMILPTSEGNRYRAHFT